MKGLSGVSTEKIQELIEFETVELIRTYCKGVPSTEVSKKINELVNTRTFKLLQNMNTRLFLLFCNELMDLIEREKTLSVEDWALFADVQLEDVLAVESSK